MGVSSVITLQQLTYFRELAKIGHLSQAAEKLYITQPTLSNVIANLEKQLGIKLFERVGRRLRLSEAGELYYGYVSQALDALDAGQAGIDSLLREQSSSVRIAVNNSIVWAELIRSFQEQHRECSMSQVDCIDGEQTRNMLLKMEVDYAIGGVTDFSLAGLDYQPMREELIGVCLPKTHPLAGREQIALQELDGEKFINLPAKHPFQRYCNQHLEASGIHYTVLLENNYRLNTTLIESGAGVALATSGSYLLSASYLGGRTVFVPAAIPPRIIALIWNPRRRLSPVACSFRKFVAEWEEENKK